MSFSLHNLKIHSPAIFDQWWWCLTRIILMCMRNYQANLQTPTVAAVASALMDRQVRTRMSQGGVILNLNLPRNNGKKKPNKCGNGVTSWKEQQGTGLNMNAWPPPQHFGRLYGKQVKWWQSGKSSWEASIFVTACISYLIRGDTDSGFHHLTHHHSMPKVCFCIKKGLVPFHLELH